MLYLKLTSITEGASMNPEQFKDNWDQLKGEIQRRWVNLTDEDMLKIKGNQERFNRAIHRRYGELEQEVNTWVDWLYTGYETSKRRRFSLSKACNIKDEAMHRSM